MFCNWPNSLVYWPEGIQQVSHWELLGTLPKPIFLASIVGVQIRDSAPLWTKTAMMSLGYLHVSPETLDACLYFLSFSAPYWLTLNKSLMVVRLVNPFKYQNGAKQYVCFLLSLLLGIENEAVARLIIIWQIQWAMMTFSRIDNKSRNAVITSQWSASEPDWVYNHL